MRHLINAEGYFLASIGSAVSPAVDAIFAPSAPPFHATGQCRWDGSEWIHEAPEPVTDPNSTEIIIG